MHSLVVVSHPNPNSLTHAVAHTIMAEMKGLQRSVELADLHREGFDPVFTMTDVDVHLGKSTLPADIVAEQKRIEGAESLVLVFPIYWWSLPAMLKGWIDRVFVNGWAYDDSSSDKLVKKLEWLPVHWVALAGADMRTYARHGYFGAMKSQISHGIFDYCGAKVKTSELLVGDGPEAHLQAARGLAARIAA
ncbi:NAD(P)H-dependent oxidoreductase [Parasphingorhabdus litoris]|uniref:NAD(P)H-dependent oxidoreductase n=1 Tax=Parasphingorhabdus litoris TaxID=394733 RepID=A0ABN1A0X5_9SPHN|nr:NAD(P)H-dependent oxidoreductase [Parasphingorhabdus litoris]